LKGLPGANTLAYHKSSFFMAVKSFIALAFGANAIKRVFSVTDALNKKLECLPLERIALSFIHGHTN
jgi:hypothetical protein